MNNAITNPGPHNYDAGLDFNFGVWQPGTTVTFTRASWGNSYRDYVPFASASARDSYFNRNVGQKIEIRKLTYHRPGQPIRVDVPVNVALTYNYIKVENPAQPISGDVPRTFYYWILDAQHIAPNTTLIDIQLDVLQSYPPKFKRAFVEQGHLGIANQKNFDNFGRDFLTTPEGLNIGSDYRVIAKRQEKVMTMNPSDYAAYMVLVISTIKLEGFDWGTEEAPKIKIANGGNLHGVPSGAAQYVFKQEDFKKLMLLLQEFPWIAQGIISITAVPQLGRYAFTSGPSGNIGGAVVNIPFYQPGIFGIRTMRDFRKNHFQDWRNSPEILNKIPERYRHLRKLFTFPYMAIELTAWSGTPVIIKPETWNDAHATLIERMNYLPPGQRLQIIPLRVNADSDRIDGSYSAALDGTTMPEPGGYLDGEWVPGGTVLDGWTGKPYHIDDDGGDFLDVFTQISAFPSFALVNNMAIQFMAQNAHGLAYAAQSADWSQDKANRGSALAVSQAQLGRDTASANNLLGVNNNTAQTSLANQNATTQSIIGMAGGVVNGAVGGAMGGGGAGAAIGAGTAALGGVAGMVGTHYQNQTNTQATAMNNALSTGVTANSNELNRLVSDSNYTYAKFASAGDYQNTIAGINAKVQDAQLTPPSTVGQVGGELMNLIHDNFGYSLRFKMIDKASIAVVGEYWLRFGYAVNRFVTMPESLHCMTHFTYWKLSESYLDPNSPVPEGIKAVQRGIFESGVTVWRDPDMIGVTDPADNKPLPGIEL